MHYPSYNSFAKNLKKPTMVSKKKEFKIEPSTKLTDIDVEEIRSLYNCYNSKSLYLCGFFFNRVEQYIKQFY